MSTFSNGPHGQPTNQQRILYQECLKANPCLFMRDILGMQLAPHIVAWGDMVMGYRRIGVNAARDHGKSAFFSYAYPIWRAWSEPGEEVYLFSNTLDQAKEFLDIIINGRANLKGMVDIPELAHLVPSREDLARDRRLRVNKEDVRFTNLSRIKCVGYGKSIRGRHPKYIVLDDVLDDNSMYSEMIRRKSIEYYKGAISPMLSPGGQMIAVGTPYHAEDLYFGFLRKNTQYTFKRFPGILTDRKTGAEKPLFPWRHTLDALYAKRAEIGAVAFTREIMCQPISDELSVFPTHIFPPLFDESMTIRPSRATIKAMGLSVFIGVDIARSANVGSDYFVCFVIGKDKRGNHYVLDIIRRRGLKFRNQLAILNMVSQRYRPDLVFIESNAMQQIWTDEMRRMTDVPVKEFVTTAANKYPLDKGVPGLRILMENEKLVIPRGDPQSVALTDAWIAEMQQFGYIEGRLQGIGSHDDMTMAFWFATEAAKYGGFSVAMGDDDDDDLDDDDGDFDWQAEMMGDDDDDD